MSVYAGDVDIRCDGCGAKLDETKDVYGSCCRSVISEQARNMITQVAVTIEESFNEIKSCRAAIDSLIDSNLIAQTHARDTLKAISERLGRLAN